MNHTAYRARWQLPAVTAFVLIQGILAGCQTNSWGRSIDEGGRYDMVGVHQAVERMPLEAIDIPRLVDPDFLAMKKLNLNKDEWQELDMGKRIDAAFDVFYTYDRGDLTKLANRRNRVQERILAGSTQRCISFKNHLQRAYARTNFTFGVLSTVAGITGAVVERAMDAKRLAAAAGIFGGVRSEWNQDFLANLTVNVIVAGIELRQADLYSQVVVKGQSKSIEIYPVEAAVKDALFIHGQCSVITGLQVAADSIKLQQNPGLENATEIMMRVQNARLVADGKEPDLNIGSKIAALRTPSTLVGTIRKEEPPALDVVDELNSLRTKQSRYAADLPAAAVKGKPALDKLAEAIVTAKCEDIMRKAHQETLAANSVFVGAADSEKEAKRLLYLKAVGAEESIAEQLRRVELNLDAAYSAYTVGSSIKDAKLADLDAKLEADITNNAINLIPQICK
jgi:hypothetical protein